MAEMKTVPIFDPTGKVRLIPEDQVNAALAAGGQRAVKMEDPRGTPRWIKDSDVEAAMKAGGRQITDQDSHPGAISRFASSAADASGLSTIGHALAHPIDTAGNVLDAMSPNPKPDNPIVQGVNGMIANTVQNAKKGWADYHKEGLTQKTRRELGEAVPVVGPVLAKAQEQHDAGNDAGMAGTVAGTVAGLAAPEAMKEVTPAATDFLRNVAAKAPESADNTAAGMINKTVGSRAADFKRGANPGRGYIKANLGTSGTMDAIADKAAAAKGDIANQLQDAYSNATSSGKKIPVPDVRKAINQVIDDAKNSASGPGVLTDPETYEELRKTFEPSLADAEKNGGFTPNELWDIRKNIDRNLNWGDQSKLNMTKVQQRVSGSLGGLLKDIAPETVDLNQQYSDLNNLADRAELRTLTHQTPLSTIKGKLASAAIGAATGSVVPGGPVAGALAGAALDSIPVKTALANWISKAGRAAPSIAEGVGESLPAVGAVPPSLAAVSANHPVDGERNDENQKDENKSNDVVQGASASPSPSITPQPTIQDKTVVPEGAAKGIAPVTLPVEVPPPDSSTLGPQSSLEPTPETHIFSTSQFQKASPGADPEAAAEMARQAGYEVA